jgi:hypothetical protein
MANVGFCRTPWRIAPSGYPKLQRRQIRLTEIPSLETGGNTPKGKPALLEDNECDSAPSPSGS